MPFRFSRLHSNGNKIRLSLLCFVLPLSFFGQSLTGLWTGSLSNDSNTVRKDQLFEIALTEYKGKVFGYSRSEFIVNDTLYYIVKKVKGTILGDVCEVTDDDIIAYNFRGKLDKGIKVTSTFKRNITDSSWYLAGTWKTNATKKYYSVSGKAELGHETNLAASKLLPHLEELSLTGQLAFYRERTESAPIMTLVKPQTIKTEYRFQNQALSVPQVSAVHQPELAWQEPEPFLPDMKRPEMLLARTETKDVQPEKLKLKPAVTSKATAPGRLQAAEKNSGPDKKQEIAAAHKTEQPAINSVTLHEVNTKTAKAQPSPDYNQTLNNAPVVQKNNNTTKPVTANSEKNRNSTAGKPATPIQTSSTTVTARTAAVNKNIASAPASSETGNASLQPQTEKPVEKTVVSQPAAGSMAGAERKENKTAAVAPVERKSTEELTRQVATIAGRKSEFLQVVEFKTDSLELALYDNGEIDGDTVSVLMNGETILAKQGLKASAIRKTIYIQPGRTEDFTLVLFADNLGKYPPNTGLLVVHDGEDIYHLRFSSDFQKSSGIIFRRKN